ncbi:MAG: FtsK/SpoIIIE domain-containing protein [Nocardioides sp.]
MSTTNSHPTSSSTGVLAAKAGYIIARRITRELVEMAREAWWVTRCLPRLVTLAVVLVAVLFLAGHEAMAVAPAVGLGGLVSWPRWGHSSWLGVTDRHRARRHRRRWTRIACTVGLATHRPHDLDRSTARPARVPRLLRGSRTRDGVSTLRLRYAPGQTLDDIERAAPALSTTLAAHTVRVVPDGPTRALVTLAHRDVLDTPSHTPDPATTAGTVLGHPCAGVEVGRVMSGSPWRVDARVHTLVAGATGSGKGSVMWSLIASLAPAVRAGTVRLVGVDLKAGMELSHASRLFSTLAKDPAVAVAALEREVTSMQARAELMAGADREHTPTTASPHVVVVIDELAALTSYLTDRDLLRRADTALRMLLSQGRAVGWSVWAWVQDPRISAVPMRDMFPAALGLRLRSSAEVDMVFAAEKAYRLAPCHHIPKTAPGTGYAVTEDGHLDKVRAHYATDDLIHHLDARYATPHRLPAPDPTPPSSSTPSTSSAASTTASEVDDLARYRAAYRTAAKNAPTTNEPPAEATPTGDTPSTAGPARIPRKPRAPRARRASRRETGAAGHPGSTTGGDAA